MWAAQSASNSGLRALVTPERTTGAAEPLGATVSPMRSTDNILWTVQFRDPSIKPKRFRFPIRRDVAEGQVEPFGHAPTATNDLKSPLLMGEPSGLDTAAGPVQHPTLPQLDTAAPKEQ